MSADRLNEVMVSDLSLSQREFNGTLYIRSEYFEDGQRVFFSPIDFALNGPDEGGVLTRKDYYGTEHCVKVLKKHYERNDEIPCMLEVHITSMIGNQAVIANELLWVVVKETKTTREKFNLRTKQGVKSLSFALVPDFFQQKGVRMNHLSTHNDVSAGFSCVTGIPKEYRVLGDKI